jgi:AcrR family transcriptional regulator
LRKLWYEFPNYQLDSWRYGGYITYMNRAADASARSAKAPSLTTRIGQGPVIAAAAKVFAERGFGDTRVEDILEETGIARRTFYKYFSSKEDVLAAVYELATGELLRAMRDVQSPRPLHAVRLGLDLFLDYHVQNASLLRVLVEQALLSDSPLAAARRRFRADLVQLLDAAVRASTGESHDPMLYAALVSALEGTSLDLFASGVSADRVERAKRVMHLLLERVLGTSG